MNGSYIIYKESVDGRLKFYRKCIKKGSKRNKILEEKAPDAFYLIGCNYGKAYICESTVKEDGRFCCQLSAIDLSGRKVIDSFTCVRQPYCVLNGNYLIECVSNGKTIIQSRVDIFNINSGYKKTIAKARMCIDKNDKYSGDYLLIAGGNEKTILFQKVKVIDSIINNDTKADIYEYDIMTNITSLVLNNTSVVTFLSGNKDRYVVTRYYYDIEKGNPNATIMMIDNQKKEFKDTSVTEEVEDGKWISHNSGIFLTRKRVYFVNDKRVKEINLNGLKTNVSLIADNKLYLYTVSKRHTISLYQIRGTL